MKISENTSVSMPVKNMLMIIAGVVAGVFAYTEITARLTSLETNLNPEDQSNKRKYDDDRFWKPELDKTGNGLL